MEDLNKMHPTEHRKLLIKTLQVMINLKAKMQNKTPLQVSTEMAQEAIDRKNSQYQKSEPDSSNRLTSEEMKEMKEGVKKAHREIEDDIQKEKKD